MIGRQSAEVGEVRRLLEEQQVQQPQAPSTTLDEDAYLDALEEDPARAVALAVQAQDPYAFDRALQAWHEADSYAATRYQLEAQRQQLEQARSQEQAEVKQYITVQEQQQAYALAKSRHSDFGQFETAMSETLQEAPWLYTPLTSGSTEQKAQAFESLYLIAKGKAAGEPVAAAGTGEQVPHVATSTAVPEGQPAPRRDPLWHLTKRLIDEDTLAP